MPSVCLFLRVPPFVENRVMNEQEVIEMLRASKKDNSELWEAWEMQRMRLDRTRAMFSKAQKKGLPVDPLVEHLDNAIQYMSNVLEGLWAKKDIDS